MEIHYANLLLTGRDKGLEVEYRLWKAILINGI